MGNDAVESSGTAHGVFLFPAEEREESRPISRVVFRSLTALHLGGSGRRSGLASGVTDPRITIGHTHRLLAT